MAVRMVEMGSSVENIRVLWKGIFAWVERGYAVVKR